MKKFIVETYYTCTFKTVHQLDDLNDQELSKIDSRSDGDVQVIDVKLNNRKTKKLERKKTIKIKISKLIIQFQITYQTRYLKKRRINQRILQYKKIKII